MRLTKNIERGKKISQQILSLNPSDTDKASMYVTLANIHAALGQFQESAKIRDLMIKQGIKKIPGYSNIEINGETSCFIVNDWSHPRAEEIRAKLLQLKSRMKEEGYVPDTSYVLHDVEEEVKEHILCFHSEKMAIAYGLISTPENTPLLITKNLRICGDCHSATAFLSRKKDSS